MKKMVLSGLMATALAASFAIASGGPANAAPVYVSPSVQAKSSMDVQKVQYRREWRDGYWQYRHHLRRDRWERRHAWRARQANRWAMRQEWHRRHYYDDYYRPHYRYHHRPGISLYFSN
ncbi:hypothetical protein SAZ10_15155 [Mesorhizobium sp. BAC0120]|uniref:hypothetical protein n=1 Tax=Mesorhizobium sp. BAC0120 TaxID=3090670 RepID=UPI00298CF5FE|nr:hypothetical protein [Mesorhizobium sp. BAC0120]MDW6023097.1 hypothetical protein [Mesorhizobium sp. BAC0120]